MIGIGRYAMAEIMLTEEQAQVVGPQKNDRCRDERQSEVKQRHGLAAVRVRQESQADVARDGADVVGHSREARPLRPGQSRLGRHRCDVRRQPCRDAPPRERRSERHRERDERATPDFALGK